MASQQALPPEGRVLHCQRLDARFVPPGARRGLPIGFWAARKHRADAARPNEATWGKNFTRNRASHMVLGFFAVAEGHGGEWGAHLYPGFRLCFMLPSKRRINPAKKLRPRSRKCSLPPTRHTPLIVNDTQSTGYLTKCQYKSVFSRNVSHCG